MSKEEPAKKKKKKKGSDTVISSYGKALNKQVFNMIKTHKYDVRCKNDLTENMLNDLSNHLENELNFAEQSSVATLTNSIRHSLDLHFSHINEYIENIQKEFVDVEDIELNFMFDITSDFYGRFLQLPNMFFDGWNILMLYNDFIDLLDDFNNKQTDEDGNSINPRLISNFIINVHDHHNKMYEVLIIPNQNVKEYIETQLHQKSFINTKMFCVSNLCHNFKVEYKRVPNGVVEYFSYDAFAYDYQWQKIYNSNQTKQLLVEMKKCIFKEPQLIFVDHNIWLMFCMEYPLETWLLLDMIEWSIHQKQRYLYMGQWYKPKHIQIHLTKDQIDRINNMLST